MPGWAPGWAIKVNGHLETTARGVYAIGDVTSSAQLAHTATYEGLHVANQIITGAKSNINYDANPNAVYSDPEVASVGLPKVREYETKGEVISARIPFAAVGKSQVEGEAEGFLKLYALKEKGTVLGACRKKFAACIKECGKRQR